MIRCVEHLVLATPPPTNMRSPTPMGTYQTCFARNSLPMRDGPEVTAGCPVPNHSGNHNPPTAHQGLMGPTTHPSGYARRSVDMWLAIRFMPLGSGRGYGRIRHLKQLLQEVTPGTHLQNHTASQGCQGHTHRPQRWHQHAPLDQHCCCKPAQVVPGRHRQPCAGARLHSRGAHQQSRASNRRRLQECAEKAAGSCEQLVTLHFSKQQVSGGCQVHSKHEGSSQQSAAST